MSAGELLREELKKENENSKLISSYIKDGKIVQVLFVDSWLKERNNNKFVTKGDYKYCFRTIPTGNYDTISLNQAIVDVMNTAYAKVNNACLLHVSAQPGIINNIITI